MAPDAESSATDQRLAALRGQLADCRKALEYLDDPRYGPIQTYFRGVLQGYEATLHNVNIDPVARDRACYVVDAMTKVLRITEYFQRKLQQVEGALKEQESPAARTQWERILSFMR